MKQKVFLIIAVLLGAILIIGLFLGGKEESSSVEEDFEFSVGGESWKTIELVDISTEDTYTMNEFVGKPILLESFAVWCPTCTRQQKKIRDLHEEVGDSVISISLDTDVNEDEEKVRQHIEDNGFGWIYSVSSNEMNLALNEEFGSGIFNAPSAPIVLICGDGRFRMLDSGVKEVPELKSAIASCDA